MATAQSQRSVGIAFLPIGIAMLAVGLGTGDTTFTTIAVPFLVIAGVFFLNARRERDGGANDARR